MNYQIFAGRVYKDLREAQWLLVVVKMQGKKLVIFHIQNSNTFTTLKACFLEGKNGQY